MKKISLFIALLLVVQFLKVDAQGVWTNENPTAFTYGFGITSGTYNATTTAKSAVSTSTVANFLPSPSSGFARVYTGNSNNGGFELTGSSSLTLTASNGTPPSSTNKMSVYNINGAETIASYFFTISFNGTDASTGALTFAIGNSANSTENNNIFNDGNNLQGASATGVFTYLRWDMTASNIGFYYRNKSDYSPQTINSVTFTKTGGPYNVEVYANNHASAAGEYTRNSTQYQVASGKFHIWVNDIRIGGDFDATTEVTRGLALNSFLLQGIRSTAGTLAPINISNVSIKHTIGGTLPVTFVDFTAIKNSNSAFLKWQTSSEKDNEYFQVLRKTEISNGFEVIAKVVGKLNSTELNHYSYTDFNPAVGNNYYQIGQVDRDGKTSIFEEVASVSFELGTEIKFSKVGDVINIAASSITEGDGSVMITDLSGKKVLNQKIRYQKQINSYDYNLTNMPAGVYVARIVMGDKSKSFKFIK
ncbi:T9SS type A sorting domain-containing protein [Pedobacter xixiisoli]|uniref:Por secretion system C-terminal sorting domain-containing protein n=1 Tax=Pedobacter xixiisoli TaxID=1476464 RepID=A0A285ZUH1_9SPHI|nr:T9SS type A sorting domain-containing protein [Pedobacter xixiisoli]SOD13305.1 Por secretion system C-terminal sorting domain-containing protein [Pedobacter xixiisoli]